MIETGTPYHKSIAVIFGSRILQIGDDQWPDTDVVGYNVDKRRHTQVVSQDGFSQSGAEDIQSRVSAIFSRLTMNSVMASPSKPPNSIEAVHCRQRLNKRRSKTGWSIRFGRYALPRYLQKASTRMFDLPLVETTDASGPSSITIRPNGDISWWGSLL